MRRLLVLFLLVTAPSDEKLTIRVTPTTLFGGGAIRLTCRVPRDPDNRRLEYGVEGYTSSERQLDGEASRVTWDALIDHVPCGVERVFCEVTRADRKRVRATAPLVVVCEG